jgi:hypothetical protein
MIKLTAILSALLANLGIATVLLVTPAVSSDTKPEVKVRTTIVDQRDTLAPYLEAPIVFQHGDISWLPQLATQAGWPPKTWRKLGQIILRESGGCPNRKGGDIVDKDCNVTGVAERTHRSDSGLLQLNGVHWKPDHKYYAGLICKKMDICTQRPLLDAKTNLLAGKLLWDVAGWDPWTPQN